VTTISKSQSLTSVSITGRGLLALSECNFLAWHTLQHTATHCNTLQHTATHCNTLQHTTTHCNTLQQITIHCNTLPHIATGLMAGWSAKNSIAPQEEPQWSQFCYDTGSTGLLSGSAAETRKFCQCLLDLPGVFLLQVFFIFEQAIGRGRWRILQTLGPQYPRNLTIVQDPHVWGRTNIWLAQTLSLHSLPLVVNSVSCWVRSKRKHRGLV